MLRTHEQYLSHVNRNIPSLTVGVRLNTNEFSHLTNPDREGGDVAKVMGSPSRGKLALDAQTRCRAGPHTRHFGPHRIVAVR